jgi:hypothetical protein
MRFAAFKVLTFDCYSTQIDWESGMIAALMPLTARVTKPLSGNASLAAHARYESSQQRTTPTKPCRALRPVVYQRLAEEGSGARMKRGTGPRYDFKFNCMATMVDQHRQQAAV